MGASEIAPLLAACEQGLRDLLAQLDDPGVPVERLDAARRRWDATLDEFLDALQELGSLEEPGRSTLTRRLEGLSALCAVVRRRTEEERGLLVDARDRARAENRRLRAHDSGSDPAGNHCDLAG